MKKKSINISKIIDYFNAQKINKYALNKLFYYSLFDSSSFEADEEFFPTLMVKKFREETIRLLKEIFSKKKHPEIYNFLSSQSFNEFEKRVIADDTLSRIILSKQLSHLGIKAKVEKSGKYDLKIGNKMIIEVKRFCLWGNYSEEITKFLEKANRERNKNFIYVIAHTHPLVITERIIRKNEHLKILNKYVAKIAKSHYIAEKLINSKNVKFVIGYIDKNGSNGFNLETLCEKIKQKIEEFGE